MADNYLQFSVGIALSDNDEQAKRELAWFEGRYEEKHLYFQDNEDALKPPEEKWWLSEDVWPDFTMEHEPNAVYLFAEEFGNVEQVARFIQDFLREFKKDKPVVLEWAMTCSKPRVGEFGGGAVCIGPDRMVWVGSPAQIALTEYENGEE